MENELNLSCETLEQESEKDPDIESILRKTVGKTTYIANLHFKEQGQTFTQKFKRVLKAESGS